MTSPGRRRFVKSMGGVVVGGLVGGIVIVGNVLVVAFIFEIQYKLKSERII